MLWYSLKASYRDIFNPLYSDGFSHSETYDKDGSVLDILRDQRKLCTSVLKILLIANSAFHLGLHCFPKYRFRCFQYTKGQGVPQDMFSFRNVKDTLDIDLGKLGIFMLFVVHWLKIDAKSPNQNAQICFTLPVV